MDGDATDRASKGRIKPLENMLDAKPQREGPSTNYNDIPEAGANQDLMIQQDSIIWELLQGNRAYVKWLSEHDDGCDSPRTQHDVAPGRLKQVEYLQQIEEERLGSSGGPLRPMRPKALTISCSRSFSPMDHIFGTDARSLMSISVAGYTCSQTDSVVGSVEHALATKAPPLLVVVGNTRNDVVAITLRQV